MCGAHSRVWHCFSLPGGATLPCARRTAAFTVPLCTRLHACSSFCGGVFWAAVGGMSRRVGVLHVPRAGPSAVCVPAVSVAHPLTPWWRWQRCAGRRCVATMSGARRVVKDSRTVKMKLSDRFALLRQKAQKMVRDSRVERRAAVAERTTQARFAEIDTRRRSGGGAGAGGAFFFFCWWLVVGGC